MKTLNKYLAATALTATMLFSSCSKFDEINENPFGARSHQVQVEYFINNSIIGAQMDPHIAERIYVLYWMTAGHFSYGGGISVGTHNDGWSTDYFSKSYMAGWLSAINSAIDVADSQLSSGNMKEYTQNLKQVARIWRAYLMSEIADTYGPIPILGFKGENPVYNSVEEVYDFILKELKEAEATIDLGTPIPNDLSKFDPAYGYNLEMWKKYANSLRMRYAMRLSEVNPTRARSEFEDAVSKSYISNFSETFKVEERPGWDPLSGVMTREWNPFMLSATLNTLYQGLGGIRSQDQLSPTYHTYIKPEGYVGVYYPNHFATATNYPTAGYFLDGLPNKIDPRAYKAFVIPGDFSNPEFNSYPSWTNDARTTERNLLNVNGTIFKTIDAAFTWNAPVNGAWGDKGAKNQLAVYEGTAPRLANKFRNNTAERIFFAPWESNFLIAEAAVRGWNVPKSGQQAYEDGIAQSFEYWGVSSFLADYLNSTEYNMAGTSVAWTHMAEPPATHTMSYVDGETGATGTVEIKYPDNHLYQNGQVKNDLLTKVITQKFIAQVPWLPLEAWSDHRRLGLPFFENPAVEINLTNMPHLNPGNVMQADIKNFPQRVKYPSSISNANPAGYQSAVSALGGPDEVLTPLWWAKKN